MCCMGSARRAGGVDARCGGPCSCFSRAFSLEYHSFSSARRYSSKTIVLVCKFGTVCLCTSSCYSASNHRKSSPDVIFARLNAKDIMHISAHHKMEESIMMLTGFPESKNAGDEEHSMSSHILINRILKNRIVRINVSLRF